MRRICAFMTFLALTSNSAFAAPRLLAKDLWAQVKALNRSACETNLSALSQGALAYRQVAPEFSIDPYTWEDLNAAELIFPILAQYSPTLLGQIRISYMLQNTSIDAEEIRLRQTAIQELTRRHDLMVKLQTLFKAFSSRHDEEAMALFLEENQKIPLASGLGEGLTLSVNHLAWAGPLATYLGTHQVAMTGAMSSMTVFMAMLMQLSKPSEHLAQLRSRHVSIKNMLIAVDEVRTALANSQSPLLKGIAEVFANFDPERYDSKQNRVARSYLRVQEGYFAKFLNMVGVSSFTIRGMNRNLSRERGSLIQVGSAFSELAALAAIARYASEDGLVYPKILDNQLPTQIKIVQAHHPYIRSDITQTSVPNTLELSNAPGSKQKFIVLTGVNTGGKSTTLRMLGTNILLGQTGAPIPAESAEWTPMAVLSNMNVNDSVQDRSSFFRAQVNRVTDIFKQMKDAPHALIMMDEIFTGTSPEEHEGAERAVIDYLMRTDHVAILATHDRALSDMAQKYPNLQNYRVGEEGEDKYVMKPGVSTTRNALSVMVQAGMPSDFIDLVRQHTKLGPTK